MDFGPEGGVDLAWILFGAGEKGLKNSGRFRERIRDNFVPVSAKIRDRIRAEKSKIHAERPPNSSMWLLLPGLCSEPSD